MATSNRKVADMYANVLYDEVTESAANTLTFESIDVGLNIFDKVGMKLSRLEYSNFFGNLAADADVIRFGLSQSNSWTTPTPAESSVIDFNQFTVAAYGTAGNALIHEQPYVKDFSTLPGGGLLIAPKPLYLFAVGSNLSAASNVRIRMFFTIVTLKPEEYFELLEARQYFG